MLFSLLSCFTLFVSCSTFASIITEQRHTKVSLVVRIMSKQYFFHLLFRHLLDFLFIPRIISDNKYVELEWMETEREVIPRSLAMFFSHLSGVKMIMMSKQVSCFISGRLTCRSRKNEILPNIEIYSSRCFVYQKLPLLFGKQEISLQSSLSIK